MFSVRYSRKLHLVLTAFLAFQGCASDPPARAPSGNFLELVAERSPPLVLRVPWGQPIGTETASAMAELGMGAMGAIGGFLFSFIPPTFGIGLIAIPYSIASGAKNASEVASCADHWEGAIDNVARWLQSNSAFLEKEVKSQLEVRGQKSIALTTIPLMRQTPALDKHDQERLLEISDRTASHTLLIGTVQLAFVAERGNALGPVKCSVKFRADALVEARNVVAGKEPVVLGSVHLSEARVADDPEFIQRATKDPELAPMIVQRVLDDLAERIAELYPKRNAVSSLPEPK